MLEIVQMQKLRTISFETFNLITMNDMIIIILIVLNHAGRNSFDFGETFIRRSSIY